MALTREQKDELIEKYTLQELTSSEQERFDELYRNSEGFRAAAEEEFAVINHAIYEIKQKRKKTTKFVLMFLAILILILFTFAVFRKINNSQKSELPLLQDTLTSTYYDYTKNIDNGSEKHILLDMPIVHPPINYNLEREIFIPEIDTTLIPDILADPKLRRMFLRAMNEIIEKNYENAEIILKDIKNEMLLKQLDIRQIDIAILEFQNVSEK